MSVQLLDKTRKINKLLHNNHSVRVEFNDICGVLSGAISALISIKITNAINLSFNLQFLISALVASLTVSGKAIGKNIAQKHSTKIVHTVAVVLNKLHLNID